MKTIIKSLLSSILYIKTSKSLNSAKIEDFEKKIESNVFRKSSLKEDIAEYIAKNAKSSEREPSHHSKIPSKNSGKQELELPNKAFQRKSSTKTSKDAILIPEQVVLENQEKNNEFCKTEKKLISVSNSKQRIVEDSHDDDKPQSYTNEEHANIVKNTGYRLEIESNQSQEGGYENIAFITNQFNASLQKLEEKFNEQLKSNLDVSDNYVKEYYQ